MILLYFNDPRNKEQYLMKKGLLIALLFLFSQSLLATEDYQQTIFKNNQCYSHVPPAVKGDKKVDLEQLPIIVSAQNAQAKQNETASFSGDVTVEQGNRHLGADKVSLDSPAATLNATGNIVYNDAILKVTADSINSDLNGNDTQLKNAEYQLYGFNGRGEAKSLHVKNQQDVVLTETSYTACPPGDISWNVKAEKIDIDSSGEWAQAHNAVVELYGVPVFYTPYLTYPISDKRKSGLLFPSFSSSTKNGIDIEQPYYFNLTNNYDLTLTPRLMSKRGLQAQGEFRYLSESVEGNVNVEYLHHDRIIDDKRWMFHWKHAANYLQHWRLKTDYTEVGDANYFNDLGSNITSDTTNQLLQSGSVQYLTRYSELNLELRNFQILGGGETTPYTMLPHLSFNASYPLSYKHLYFTLNSELTHFDNSDTDATTANRFHFEPGIQIPWVKPQGFITAEAKIIQTNYIQDISEIDSDIYTKNVSRTLPEFRLHGGLNFDRYTSIFGQQYHQTLEPQLQYLYIPYKNQDEIGIYDTAYLQQDYFGLFRDRSFSGLDRIADANQMTFGLTSRYLNDEGAERFRLSLGQNYFLESSQVSLEPNSEVSPASRSSIIIELDLNFDDRWSFHTGSEFNTEDVDINKANAAIEYRPAPGKLAQINYRFSNENLETESINQIGSKFSWPLSINYQLVTSYYRDLILDRSIEVYSGLQYDSCCWAVRLIYERSIETNYDTDLYQDAQAHFDASVKLQFELKGFGSIDTIKDSKMLDGSRFTYGRPFYLNY